MSLALDHVVIAVGNLAATVEDYRRLGFTVVIGGDHPGRTSHNALVVFDDGSYLELIAWKAPAPNERWFVHHEAHGDGFVDFALLPDGVASLVAGAKARGLVLNGPIDGGRVRPDGVRLAWQTARQATFDLPFLCGDVTPRPWRVPEGDCRQHANGVTGIASVTVAVDDVATSVARYRALLDLSGPAPAPGARSADIALSGCVVRLEARERAAGTAARDPGGVGALGQGVRSITLRCPSGTPALPLDMRLAHGACLMREPAPGA